MPSIEMLRPLIVVVGPTAVGKTEIAIQLAERLGGEIVSADSRLFYRGMDIGTAKPTPAELARVPHHLIDVADPPDTWSLTIFQQEAARTIAEIDARGRLPFLVGGTGQYVHAVMEGWQVPTQQPDPHLREVLEGWAEQIGPQALHDRLAILDPEAGAAIQMENVRRNIRALEVIFLTGRRFSEQRLKGDAPYRLLIIGLQRPRAELYARIDARIEAMLAAGFVDEVRGLLDRGYSPSLPTMSAIGYREMVYYLRGRMTLTEAAAQMKRFTRRYVRQQDNWFRAENPSIHWFQVGPDTAQQAEQLVRDWLALDE